MLDSLVKDNQLYFRSPGILTVGSPMVDLIAHVDEKTLERLGAKRASAFPVSKDHFDELLGKVRRPIKRCFGGSAANVSCALAKMYGRTSFVGRIGVDDEGLFCRTYLAKQGVLQWLSVDFEKSTGRVLILVTPDGERSMISSLGASENFNVNELTGREFFQMGVVHFEGYHLSHFEATLRMMGMAKGHGGMVSLDLASKDWVSMKLQEFRYLIHEYVNILFGNFGEMQALMEIDDPELICKTLSTQLYLVCLTLGDQGVWIGCGGSAKFFPTKRVEPVDTTGAGDLFCAGMLHSVRWNMSLESGVALAQDLAATVVQREGAQLLDSDWDRIKRDYNIGQQYY